MIPILYNQTETEFKSGGLGYLAESASCVVTEELNGVYECEFTYPVTGKLYTELLGHTTIYATHDPFHGPQPFDIYSYSKPINGLVTFYAHHISYRLSNAILMPITAADCYEAISSISPHCTDTAFTYYTDKHDEGTFSLKKPTPIREAVADEKDSIRALYGGDLEFDHFKVSLLQRRGEDTNIEIRYGKNLIELEDKYDDSESYNAIVPYWINPENETQRNTLPYPYYVYHNDGAGWIKAIPMDLSELFPQMPTTAMLAGVASNLLEIMKPWTPFHGITMDCVQLSRDHEYKQFKELQQMTMGDTVRVIALHLGVNYQARVTKLVYDVLLDRYKEVTIGDLPTTYRKAVEPGR